MKQGLLGNTIRQARLDCKMTQEELAEAVQITPTHMKHIESEHRNPLWRYCSHWYLSCTSHWMHS